MALSPLGIALMMQAPGAKAAREIIRRALNEMCAQNTAEARA
jgi:hypothetical protein